MGGTSSTNAINKVTTDLTDIVSKSVLSCETQSKQKQKAVINNTGLSLGHSLDMEQTTTISSSCFSDITKQTEIQNKISTYLSQGTTAEGVALLPASTSAINKANIASTIKSNVTMKNIQKQFTKIQQNQSLTLNNSGVSLLDSVKMTQGAQVFAAATMKVLDDTGVLNAVSDNITQTAAAKSTNPLDFISDMLSSVLGVFLWPVLGLIALIAFIFVVKALTRKPGDKEVSVVPDGTVATVTNALINIANRTGTAAPTSTVSLDESKNASGTTNPTDVSLDESKNASKATKPV